MSHHNYGIKVMRFGSYFDVRLPCAPFGVASIQLYLPQPKYQELGWYCDFRYRNKGYTTKGVRLVLNKVLKKYPGKIVCALVGPENLPSRRVAEKAGFIQVERPRDFICRSSRRTDLLFYIPRSQEDDFKRLQPRPVRLLVPASSIPIQRVA